MNELAQCLGVGQGTMNLLFDLDGTLTDPCQGITTCIAHALASLGRPSPPLPELRWCIGPPLKNSFAKLLGSDDDKLLGRALTIYRARFGSVGLFENEVYQGIPDALAALQGMGHMLYVATSKPTVYAKQIIEHFDLRSYFVAIHGSELDGAKSDKTALLSHILQREGLASSHTRMIGDRKYDMIGARANGIRALGVLWGYGTREELEASSAYACVNHPQELKIIFNNDNPQASRFK